MKIHRSIFLSLLLTLQPWGCSFAEKRHTCPIGYTIAYNKYTSDDPICYRKKGPEKFADQFRDCAGNLYTSKLYNSLNIPNPTEVLWTEYRTMYRGGPFIDWSYTDSIGDVLSSSNEVNYDPAMTEEEACIVIDPDKNFTAARCDEKHYRYCFVKPVMYGYIIFSTGHQEIIIGRMIYTEGCKDFIGSARFYSPIPTCLAPVQWGNVTGNWSQAEKICAQRGGALLNKGWIYARDLPFYYGDDSNQNFTLPLGAEVNDDNDKNPTWKNDTRYVIPSSAATSRNGMSYFALVDQTRQAVPPSFNFTHLFICERHVRLKQVMMNVALDTHGEIILNVNETVNSNDIKCFTDSVTYYPVNVTVTYDDSANKLKLLRKYTGYYWCVLTNSKNYIATESKKELIFTSEWKYRTIPTPATNETTDYNNTQCFTGSKTYHQVNVSVTYDEIAKNFRISPNNVSYYLCFVTDSRTYFATDSKKILFIKDNDSLFNYHAVYINLTDERRYDYLNDHSQKKIEEHAFYRTYMNMVRVLSMNNQKSKRILKKFEALDPNWRNKEKKCIYIEFLVGYFAVKMKFKTERSYHDFIDNFSDLNHTQIKRRRRTIRLVHDKLQSEQMNGFMKSMHTITVKRCVYGKEVLFHGRLNPYTMPEPPATWGAVEVVSIKPVYYCNLNGSLLPLGDSTSLDCRTYTCVGDFNEGVELTTTATTSCTTTTIIPSNTSTTGDLLQQVLKDMKTLLRNKTVQMEDIGETFDKLDELLQTKDNLEIPGVLLRQLDELASRIDLNGSTSAITERSNIALLVADSNPSEPLRGLRLPVKIDANSNNSAELIFGAGDINSTLLTAEVSEAVVRLPKSIFISPRRVKFIIFTDDRAFYHSKSAADYSVNSRVLSIGVDNLTQFDIGETVEIYMKPIKDEHDVSRSCAYWHFLEDGTGYWSQKGCTFSKSTDNGVLDVCRCTHLTHFAEILIPRSEFIPTHEEILEVLTIIGCFLSIIGIFIIGVTAAVFKSWRREYVNKILLQLCVAIFFLITCFIMKIFMKFNHHNNMICMMVGVALHYSVLASFCWMLVAAVLSYKRLVIVLPASTSNKLLRASAFSWGAPCAVVGLLLAVDPHSYAGQFGEKAPSGAFCYPSGLGLWLALYAPIAIVLLTNWTLFALIVRSVFCSRKIQRHGDTNEAVRSTLVSCLLVFLFGLPWIFGLFARNIVAAYMFTLTATYQGFVLFLFFVIGNKKTRDLWLKKFSIKHCHRQVTPTEVIPKVLSTRVNNESY